MRGRAALASCGEESGLFSPFRSVSVLYSLGSFLALLVLYIL